MKQPNDYSNHSLGPTFDFLRMLWAVNHGVAMTSHAMQAAGGITNRQRLVVQVAMEWPGISPGQMAKVLCLDPGSLTEVLQQMRKQRLLFLRVDGQDRRRLRIHVAPRGRQVLEEAPAILDIAVSKALSRVPAAKLKATCDVLTLVAEMLECRKEGLIANHLGDGQPSAGKPPVGTPRRKRPTNRGVLAVGDVVAH